MMKIAIASGKGGTGKTTIATGLAAALGASGHDVLYLDCDVEEPNGDLFLRPNITQVVDVELPFPKIDLDRCTFCGECARLCEFRALAVLEDNVLLFPELCHSCGACHHLCPEKAISEELKKIGEISIGSGSKVKFAGGRLSIGVARAPAVTEALRLKAPEAAVTFLDAPPGTSCGVVAVVKDCDFVLLVTEPTPFGLNDLKLTVEMLRQLELPCAVILNRADVGDEQVEKYCRDENLEILLRIPEDRSIAEAYSEGELLLLERPEYAAALVELYEQVLKRVGDARACHT